MFASFSEPPGENMGLGVGKKIERGRLTQLAQDALHDFGSDLIPFSDPKVALLLLRNFRDMSDVPISVEACLHILGLNCWLEQNLFGMW